PGADSRALSLRARAGHRTGLGIQQNRPARANVRDARTPVSRDPVPVYRIASESRASFGQGLPRVARDETRSASSLHVWSKRGLRTDVEMDRRARLRLEPARRR